MTRSRRLENLKSLGGAFLGCFCVVVTIDRCVTALQQGGGRYGIAPPILVIVAVLALAIAMFFGNRWRNARAEMIGAILAVAIAGPLIVSARYGA